MVKPMKKLCSFATAVCVTFGSICVPTSAQTNANTTSKAKDTVSVLAESTYDDAVAFSDSVAFLENGKWSNDEWIDGENVKFENVTEETNIVIVDSTGERKIITNDDGKGGKLFEAIFPMISSFDYQFDAFKLIKNNQMTYLKVDGTFIGGKNEYYNYAFPITENILLVSDDKETYRILNDLGEVTVDNIKFTKYYSPLYIKLVYGDYLYLFGEDNYYMLDMEGNLVKKVRGEVDLLFAENGYVVVRNSSEEKYYLIDRTGNVIKSFEGYVDSVSAEYIEEGYIEYYSDTDGYIIENIETGEIVSRTNYAPDFNGNTILSNNGGGERSLYSVDGTVYIADIDKYIYDLGTQEGYVSVSAQTYFINNSFLISLHDQEDLSKAVTYVFTEQEGFVKNLNKRFEGLYQCLSDDEKYFITANSEGYIRNMCTIDGKLVKNYGENSRYGYAWPMYINYGGLSQNSVQFVFTVLDYEAENENDNYNYWLIPETYILSNGETGETYNGVYSTGNFVKAYGTDGLTYVINGDNDIVYKGEGYIAGHYYKECFTVQNGDMTILCDREGNAILGANGEYTNICGGGYGSYIANEYDDTEYYVYSNNMLANGMCIVSVIKNGEDKYGVVRVAGSTPINNAKATLSSYKYTYDGKYKKPTVESAVLDGKQLVEGIDYVVSYKNNNKAGKATVVLTGIGEYNGYCKATFEIGFGTGMYKGEDGKWHYYVNNKIDTTYTGLAKNENGWWYIKNGTVDFAYTGMAKNEKGWFYVKNGKLDLTYTGLAENQYGTWYMVNGKVASNISGLTKISKVWMYLSKGKVDTSYVGLAKNESGWWYVENGQVDFTYTGMAKNQYGWWYVKNGKLDRTYTGLTENQYGTWYMVDGKLANNISGLTKISKVWMYLSKGKVDTDYVGLAKNASGWWYVKSGTVDFTYTGMAKNQYGWWYVTKGQLDRSFTGIASNEYGRWYIKNGAVDKKYTGTLKYNGVTYNIKNGKVN